MSVVYRKISDLKKYDNNPRTITNEQLEKLKESISKNPDYFEARPIVLSNRTGELVVIAGNQRLEASMQLGLKKVPTYLLENLTEEREHELMIRDNVNNGEWDMQKLLEWDSGSLLDWGLDVDLNFDIDSQIEESNYTKKIEAPVYEPKSKICPLESSLFDMGKYDALISEINAASISPEAKDFLMIAASRHIVFDYGEIAEYYAHAQKEVQALMERSALVIIDFDKAIENGYTRLKNDIYEVMLEDTDDEE
ncbi:ParB N-terminal domain-containing protein [Bacteroides ihuae]|uniref:ParB N-terminal domain-containing protein n=1 Tax=Bacteroides ihuae TaxID=1852362 RepID=UPI0008DB1065|nr:ParB N-terminal domain-containing protein [Bacteroides ihuae]